MATKTFYATRDMKNPTGYGTRMLKAGDPVDLTGPQAKIYRAIGAVSTEKPQRAPTKSDLNSKTKAELAKLAGLSPEDANKLTKAQIIAAL